MKRVSVLGSGSFGTALADLLARQGHSVSLWTRHGARADTINETHHNPDYLSEFALHGGVRAVAELGEALARPDWIVVAVPSSALRAVMSQARALISEPLPIVLTVKGIELDTLMTMHEVTLDCCGSDWGPHVLALSGPSFAREIMLGRPTAVVLACADETLAEAMAPRFFCDSFRAYCSNDVIGVEMGGALKNVTAIAAGAITGLGLGDNPRAALMTRSLAEITRLAVAKGGQPLTLAGLAGVGDLILTCTGEQSRNRTLGALLAQGVSLDQARGIIKQVIEGVGTAAAAKRLADKLGVRAPITSAVYKVLYEGLPVADAALELVRRAPGRE